MSDFSLRPLAPDVIPRLWEEHATALVRDEIRKAGAGQCLRVSDLPRDVLESVARHLAEHPESLAEVYLVDRAAGPEPWRVGVHKVVERRNACEGVLVALFPPDLQLAAGDSVDISTFRQVSAVGLSDDVLATIKNEIPDDLQPWLDRLFDDFERRGWTFSPDAELEYAATVAAQDRTDPAVVGGALFALNLIPDFDLFSELDQFHHRLGQLNHRACEMLRDDAATPLERILRLRLKDASYQARLVAFFRNHHPSRIRDWGRVVSTDPAYRDLCLDRWPHDDTRSDHAFRIDVEPLKLARRDDGQLLLSQDGKVTVAWISQTSPIDAGVSHYRIEIANSDRMVIWESALIKVTRTLRRSRTLQDFSHLESGRIYFFRVIGLNEAGNVVGDSPLRDAESADNDRRSNESEPFFIVEPDDVDVEIGTGIILPANKIVSSYADAELLAHISALGSKNAPERLIAKELEWQTGTNARADVATATIIFDLQRQYTVRLSQRLRRIEQQILNSPELGGHLYLDLSSSDGDAEWLPVRLPVDVARDRQAIFEAIAATPMAGEGQPVVALVNLLPHAAAIEQYARSYLSWLERGDADALLLDVVRVDIPDHGSGALVAPTHPLRLLWYLQEHQLGHAWLDAAAAHGDANLALVETWRDSLSPQGIPAMLVLGASEAFLDAGPLRGGWGAYLPPRLRDSRAVLSALRARLGTGAAHMSEADVPPKVLADKFAMFLRQHPHVQALTINVINPGDAALIVDALIKLEERRLVEHLPEYRYEIRLLTDSASRANVGDAFRALLDPDRQISAAADRLVSPGQSFLFPKLLWSRNDLKDFLERPEQYQAHITILLDAFPVHARVARTDPRGRSSFVHGLVQEAPRRLDARSRNVWIRQPAPFPCPELGQAPDRSSLMAALLSAIGSQQAAVLAPNANTTEVTAVTALDLTSNGQSLLYTAHHVSTWVLTLDPHLGLDYFDEPRRGDRPGFLLDFTPEFLASGGRQLLLTTRIDDEVAHLMAPAVAKLDLDDASAGAPMLLEALRSLSGRLALRLLSSPSQVSGALGMALARLFLEAYGLLDNSIVIPLDAHPELVDSSYDKGSPNLRGDLLVLSADVTGRILDCLLVEAKFRSGAGLDDALRQEINRQLDVSAHALQNAFDPHLHDPDRYDRSVQGWRLTSVLQFYLDRARRYGLVAPDAVDSMRVFFNSLDSTERYHLNVRKVGLVFRPDGAGVRQDNELVDTPIYIVGKDKIEAIVADALQRYGTAVSAEEEPLTAVTTDTATRTMAADETWHDVRRAFGGPGTAHDEGPVPSTDESAPLNEVSGFAELQESLDPEVPAKVVEPSTPISLTPAPVVVDTPTPFAGPIPEVPSHVAPASPVPVVASAATSPTFDVMLGDTRATPQYGLLGRVAAETWRSVALDLNGCNTLSVFGVQGSGKSYTVGTILEMATGRHGNLNLLPQPLSAVVFHYHQTQDYPPEFVSMDAPNDDPDQVAALRNDWHAEPAGLQDVLVLTTEDTIAERQREFPHATVAPIAFASNELTVADWRFLMGATGSDALYLKLVNEVMRKSRTELTLDAIQAGLAESALSEQQRSLASTRLDFASRFIDDGQSLRAHLRPGRLVVVDLRDEFIEQDQALGLFVTMLNVFAGAGMGDERFNKLIVFDEAHKYMGGPLMGQVVGVIREMRHKGVSVVIASQDPVNVPAAVIELSSAVVLHRFNSPSWLRHIQKSLVALGDLTPPMMASLQPGEAFVWANKATDPTFTRRAVKLRMRPRATKHGGGTRTAV